MFTMQNNTLLRFETFETNECFAAWQASNPGLPIYQMVPVMMGINGSHMDLDHRDAKTFMQTEGYGLFVVYGDRPVETQLNG